MSRHTLPAMFDCNPNEIKAQASYGIPDPSLTFSLNPIIFKMCLWVLSVPKTAFWNGFLTLKKHLFGGEFIMYYDIIWVNKLLVIVNY